MTDEHARLIRETNKWPNHSPLEQARHAADNALANVQAELLQLRERRAEINDRIRELVVEEKVLTSMVRVAAKEVEREAES